MSRSTKIILGVLIALAIVLIIIGMARRDRTEPEDLLGNETRTEQTITARVLKDGTDYTVAGTVQLPSPCHDIDVDVTERGSSQPTTDDTDAVDLMFTMELPEADEMCTEVITDKEFRVAFDAATDAAVTATFDGTPVTLNLIPVETEEELGSVDIKG